MSDPDGQCCSGIPIGSGDTVPALWKGDTLVAWVLDREYAELDVPQEG